MYDALEKEMKLRRSIACLVALCIAIPFLGGAQQGVSWTSDFETTHYHLVARVPKEKAKELGDFMEMVFTVYTSLMHLKEKPTEKFLVQLYADRKDYVTVGRAPPMSGAYYSPAEKKLVGYYEPASMFAFFAHEGMHQFVDFAQPSFNQVAQKATWYSEGIADCIGNCEVINKKLYMCRKNGYIARIRIKTIQGAIKANKHYPLKDFFKLDKGQYYANGALCYAEGWSLCHFFMTYPKVEEKDKQIPDGKYRKFLAFFHEALSADYALDQAYEVAFQKGKGGSKMPSVEDLEKEWKEYILNFDEPPKEEKKEDKQPVNNKPK